MKNLKIVPTKQLLLELMERGCVEAKMLESNERFTITPKEDTLIITVPADSYKH